MKRDMEILEHTVKQGMSREETFEQRPEWRERNHVALVVVWGSVVLGRENNISEYEALF